MKNLVIIFLSLFFVACENESTTDSSTVESVSLNIKHTFGNESLGLADAVYENEAGNSLQISQLKYFISNFEFIKEDNSSIFYDQVHFINLEEGITYAALDIDPGNFKSIKFFIGVDSARNHSDPALKSAESVLNPANNDMHWSWMSGYIFCSIEGYLIENGNTTNAFSYHIGKMENLIKINLEFEKVQEINSGDSINLNFDLAKIFSGENQIDIKEKLVTHSSNDGGLSFKLSQNISKGFSVK